MVDTHQDEAPRWTPSEINGLLVIVTGCLCLLILVSGTLYLMATGKLSAEALGKVTSVGVGSGLAGIFAVIAWVIRVGLTKGRKS